jgi:large subunit ribosomal protein L17
MRHGKKINHLGRKSAHRHAMLSNLASSLIISKRITTTVAKAKALRKYVEPLLTKSKNDTTHSRRTVFSYLQNKDSVTTLFGEVASKIADRPGGYTRIVKLADTRVGDNAEMCLIELVDFNTLYTKDSAVKKATTRRSRAKGKKKEDGTEASAEGAQEAPAAEAKAEKKPKKAAPKKDKE